MEGYIRIPNKQELLSSIPSDTTIEIPAILDEAKEDGKKRPLARNGKEESYDRL
jgi:hypothetical protein